MLDFRNRLPLGAMTLCYYQATHLSPNCSVLGDLVDLMMSHGIVGASSMFSRAQLIEETLTKFYADFTLQ